MFHTRRLPPEDPDPGDWQVVVAYVLCLLVLLAVEIAIKLA